MPDNDKPLMYASEYNSWNTTLLNILSKHGYSSSNVPSWHGTTVEAGDPTLSSQIDNIKNDIINGQNAMNCHFPDISTLDVGIYSVDSPTLLDTKTKIEAKLSEMNAVCHHNADRNDDSDDRDHDDCTDNSINTLCGHKSEDGDYSGTFCSRDT